MIEERRAAERGRLAAAADLLYRALRVSASKADTLVGTLGIFLIGGLIVAAIGAAIFVELAGHVKAGTTQAFDESVIRWLYLSVHYPSDVIGGVAIGLARAAFCMATLEAIQKFGLRRDPRILTHERPFRPDPHDPAASPPIPAASSKHR